MAQDTMKRTLAMRDKLKQLAEVLKGTDHGAEIATIAEEFTSMTVDVTMSLDIITPILGAGYDRPHYNDITVMTLCYNAFMIGRRGIPVDAQEDRCSWYNDCEPLMKAGIDRLAKDVRRRHDYAHGSASVRAEIHNARQNEN